MSLVNGFIDNAMYHFALKLGTKNRKKDQLLVYLSTECAFINPFQAIISYLYLLKKSENHRFSDIFLEGERGRWIGSIDLKWIMSQCKDKFKYSCSLQLAISVLIW